MTKTTGRNPCEGLESQHDDLMKEIAEVLQFWVEVNELGQGPKYEEMSFRVHQFREQLKEHFESEERDGYLDPSIAAVPELASRLNALRRQHPQFLDDLDRFAERLENRESFFQNWEDVHREFERFVKRLHEHEAAEMEIIREPSKAAGWSDAELNAGTST